MGRLCQAPVRRARGGAGLSVALHPSGRHLQLRLLALDERGVTFRWKDYRAKGRTRHKTMTLSAAEFMRRFLLHVLPSGFHRIRHYGLLANASAADQHRTARALLQAPAPAAPLDPNTRDTNGSRPPTFVCRHCGAPMLIIETFTRAHTSAARPP